MRVKKEENKKREIYQQQVREIMYKNREDLVQQLLTRRHEKEETLQQA